MYTLLISPTHPVIIGILSLFAFHHVDPVKLHIEQNKEDINNMWQPPRHDRSLVGTGTTEDPIGINFDTVASRDYVDSLVAAGGGGFDGELDADTPLESSFTTSGYTHIINPIQTARTNNRFLFSINSTDNAGSTRDNTTFNMGFGIDAGGGADISGLSGIGLSFEDHYEPTAGDSLAEYHTFFVDAAGDQHRLQSYTITKDDETAWDMYQTISEYGIKDPTNDSYFFRVNRGGATGSTFQLLGSSSSKGANFIVDASATNLTISPEGYAGTSKIIYMNDWDDARLPSLRSYVIGGTNYNTATSNFLSSADNGCELGINGFRFKNYAGCGIDVSSPGAFATKYFTVSNTGVITAPNLPTYANEAAAVTAGLATGTIYKTATGELRIKL